MKPRYLAIIAWAALLMAAAPPPADTREHGSIWSRIVARTKALVHNPFGPARPDAGNQRPPTHGTVRRRPTTSGPPSRRQPLQTSAFAPESIAADIAARKSPRAERTAWFSREKPRRRTVSEYMAQEKP